MRASLLVVPLALLAVAAAPPRAKVKTAYFGERELADGELMVMDGGIHGVQGHTVVLGRDGSATWERRVESLQPSGKPGAGAFTPTADELARLRKWSDALWQRAEKEPRSFFPPPDRGPPRWVWAVVQRRGDTVRVLEGGGMSSPEGAPDEAKPLLGWLVKRVDELGKP